LSGEFSILSRTYNGVPANAYPSIIYTHLSHLRTNIISLQKITMNRLLIIASLAVLVLFESCKCNPVQPNFEGVLMQNYGRNGKDDFKQVTGAQGILGPGSELYQVPMYEQTADPTAIEITAKDAGVFTVDPSYTYQAIRGKGVDIIFHYKHVGIGDQSTIMDNIEGAVLNKRVTDIYREEARNFTTDSIMNNLNQFERVVEGKLKEEFKLKFFALNALTSGLRPPKSMADAVERRNNAIQQAEQVKNELQVAEMNLQKAKIEAEENKVRASGLTATNLQEKWIEAIRTTQNKVIITDGRTPVIFNH
jgi:regulator of protease activity HflC (stomatin/prohibitin superfamily)